MTSDTTVIRSAVHPGVYKDSLVLMQLQHRLLDRQGVTDAGAVMASRANLELLRASRLLPEALPNLAAEDLLVVVRAESVEAADNALASTDELLASRGDVETGTYRPRSIEGALSRLPEARWALVSVPGRYAARVAEEALDHRLSVFLYSDNVEVAEEVRLKSTAAARGLMCLGPDCGTAIVAGAGMGFANRVRRGPIGLAGGSGTGLQAVSVAIHASGGGVSQAIGTGGRDLSHEVGGTATRQALRILNDDADTEVIVLISKCPSPSIARLALEWAAACTKPVVVYLQGFSGDTDSVSDGDDLHLAASLAEAAHKAVQLVGLQPAISAPAVSSTTNDSATGAYLRGLFAGGTLAAETLYALENRLEPLHSNLHGGSWRSIDDLFESHGHTVLDLGADELTRGRLHPIVDQEIRLKRLAAEAADPKVGLILLDVVLGEGAHGDPAAELAPAIQAAIKGAERTGRGLQVVAIVIGTEEDPQDLAAQIERLQAAGATVVRHVEDAVRFAETLQTDKDPTVPLLGAGRASRAFADHLGSDDEPARPIPIEPVSDAAFEAPLAAINIGLESFHDSLLGQGARVVHVDWRPPAGGNERLTAILDRLRGARPSVIESHAEEGNNR